MDGLGKLSWYARRLSRMSPPELAHRLGEQAHALLDARRPGDWARFGDFAGPILPLPGLDTSRASPAMRRIAAAESGRAMDGAFDYLGQAWPSLGERWEAHPSAWTLDPVSGLAWPGAGTPWARAGYRHAQGMGDVKYVWELNRLQFLGAVGLAAWEDEAAAAFGYRALAGWMAANPPFEGVNWTSGIEAASRVVSALWLLACAPPPSPPDERRVRAFLQAHGERLARYPSLHSSANNHRVSELAGLFLLGLCAPGLPTAVAWLAEGRAGLEAEIGRQFHADGVGAEQSPTYAAYSLEWFALAGVAAQAVGEPFSPAYRDAASRAAEHLRWMLDASGRTPRLGDDDEGRVLTLRQAPEERYVASVVAMVRRWAGEPPLDPAPHDPDLRDLIGPPLADGAASVSPPLGLRTFAEGGLTLARETTPCGPSLVVFDHGPLGFLSIAAHGHADALSVTLSWGEEPVLVDPGTYLYHAGGDARDRFRGTAAHNTLCVEGADQSRILGPFAWDRHAITGLLRQGPDSVEAEHDGYRARFGVAHRRRLTALGGGAYDIADILIGPPGRALDWTAGFTLAPGCAAIAEGAVATVTTVAGRVLTLTTNGEAAGGWRMVAADHSPRFSRLEPTLRLQLAGRMEAGVAQRAFTVRLQLLGA